MRWVVIILLLVGDPVHSQQDSLFVRAPRWTARAQFAGLQGTASGGLLWNVPDGRLQMGVLYGHTPAMHGGEAFHGLVVRINGSLFPVHKPMRGPWGISPTASISALIDVGGATWLTLPPEFPSGYYGPTGLHGLLAVGARFGHWQHGRAWAITVETVALDTYLWYALSRKSIPFSDAWSLALGVEHHF